MKLSRYQAVLDVRPWPVVGCDCVTCRRIRRYHATLARRRTWTGSLRWLA